MKIAINGAFYQPKGGGVKEYIDNLVRNLVKLDNDNEYILYVLQDQLDYAQKNLPSNIRLKTIPYNSKTKIDRIKRSLFENRFWLREEKEEKFDIFHSPFFHAPSLKKVKVLLTVHDLRLYRFPETYEFMRYKFLKRKVRNSIKKADHIISISEFTKQEIIELCDVDKDKITVILEAINPNRFSCDNNSLPDDIPESLKGKRFLLAVGHLEPRKNYDRLIEAFIKLKENLDFKDLQLVIVGKKDHSFKQTLKKIENTPGVYYLNFVSHELLIWLYKNCSLFIFPSYYEGFGFPPLEAASLGSVSAVSNVSSIPEICGDAAFYFDPFNVNEMASTIQFALTHPIEFEEMRKKIILRINQFSWEKNAAETLNVYKHLYQE